VVVAPELSENVPVDIVSFDAIPDDQLGVDIGPDTTMIYMQVIESSKTILWNGPMGVFEITPFSTGTESVARKLAEVTAAGAITVIGGGDSAAAMSKFGLADKVTHISTGGGASLELLAGLELEPINLITKK